jgi:nicotinamide-nucleotide amidase
MLPQTALDQAASLLLACRRTGVRVATVESCTGGLIAAALTAGPGASEVFDRGFVTYSNQAKHDLVGVPIALIETHGAVSEQVARAMAEGGLARSAATLAVAVTGLAGPGGGTADKPVGLVCFGLARRGRETVTSRETFTGDRAAVRGASLASALRLIAAAL